MNPKDYAMHDVVWKIDLPAFLKELRTGVRNGPYAPTFVILNEILAILAQRCAEINDPVLNIIMLNMKLYEVKHEDIHRLVEEQRKRIK